jgi:hypothetical protein
VSYSPCALHLERAAAFVDPFGCARCAGSNKALVGIARPSQLQMAGDAETAPDMSKKICLKAAKI